MSYREEGDSVILTMSREDYGQMQFVLAVGAETFRNIPQVCELLNRLNQGNPNYTPYVTEDGKEPKK